VINLPRKAGVRFLADQGPHEFSIRISRFPALLEGCRHNGVEPLGLASSIGVRANTILPFSVHRTSDQPAEPLWPRTKGQQLRAHTYGSIFSRLPVTGLRFFTVYGPGGPADSRVLFTDKIHQGEPIDVFNPSSLSRLNDRKDHLCRDIVQLGCARPTGWPTSQPALSAINRSRHVVPAPYRLVHHRQSLAGTG